MMRSGGMQGARKAYDAKPVGMIEAPEARKTSPDENGLRREAMSSADLPGSLGSDRPLSETEMLMALSKDPDFVHNGIPSHGAIKTGVRFGKDDTDIEDSVASFRYDRSGTPDLRSSLDSRSSQDFPAAPSSTVNGEHSSNGAGSDETAPALRKSLSNGGRERKRWSVIWSESIKKVKEGLTERSRMWEKQSQVLTYNQMVEQSRNKASRWVQAVMGEDGMQEFGGSESFARRELKAADKKWLLDPKGHFFTRWDIWSGILLLYTALVTPVEVAFLTDPEPPYLNDPLFCINRVVDITFICDLFFQFFLPFQNPITGTWITKHSVIVSNYLRGWFFCDLISVLPLDLIEAATGTDTSNLKVMRLVRLLRLMKLLRLMRSSRVFQRWESKLQIDYAVLDLQKFVVALAFVAHWLACGWRMLVGEVSEEDVNQNWVVYYSGMLDINNGVAVYMASLYWAVATLSTLGYGDVLPVNDFERVFCIIATVVGSSIYAYMVGAVCGLLAGMNEENATFYKTIDHLNAFMREKQFPAPLRERLRDYFRFTRKHGHTDVRHDLLHRMSQQLRNEVAEHVHASWINKVSFFRGVDSQEFYTEVAMALSSQLFSRGEVVVKDKDLANRMFIVEKGIVACNGRIHTAGMVFGQDMIGASSTRRRNYVAMSLINSAMLVLQREALDAILAHYPDVYKMLRKEVVRSLCKDAIMTYTKAVRRLTGTKLAAAGDQLMVHELDLKHLHPDLLKMLLQHRVLTMRKEMPNAYNHMNKAALMVQKNLKMMMCRRLVRREIHERRGLTYDQLCLVKCLDQCNLAMYRKKLITTHKLDIAKVKALTVTDLYLCAEMPMGDAVDLLKAVSTFAASEHRRSMAYSSFKKNNKPSSGQPLDTPSTSRSVAEEVAVERVDDSVLDAATRDTSPSPPQVGHGSFQRPGEPQPGLPPDLGLTLNRPTTPQAAAEGRDESPRKQHKLQPLPKGP